MNAPLDPLYRETKRQAGAPRHTAPEGLDPSLGWFSRPCESRSPAIFRTSFPRYHGRLA